MQSVELPRVDDLAAVDADGELGHLDDSSSRNDGDFRDANPVGVVANDDR
jgi:hypothetical protein